METNDRKKAKKRKRKSSGKSKQPKKASLHLQSRVQDQMDETERIGDSTDLYSKIFPNSSDSEDDRDDTALGDKQEDLKNKKDVKKNQTMTKSKKSKSKTETELTQLLDADEDEPLTLTAEPGKRKMNTEDKVSKKKTKKETVVIEKLTKPVPVRNFVTKLKVDESSSSEDEESDKNFEFDNDSGSDMGVDAEEGDGDPESEKSESESGEDSEDESDQDSETEGQRHKTVLRRQLKDLSFEELEALKQKMGLKEFNEAMFGSRNRNGKPTPGPKRKRRKFERTNKNRPREMSSKVRVPKLREIVKVPKKVRKDPRFDDAFGQYSEKFWNSEYSFLRDIQKQEAEHLKKNLKSINDEEKKEQMKRFIQKVTDKEKAIAEKQKEAMKMQQEWEDNKKRMEEGKRPYYVKKGTRKLMDLVEKYDELKSSGRLEKYLKKKRRKNAMRDRKTLNPTK